MERNVKAIKTSLAPDGVTRKARQQTGKALRSEDLVDI